MRVIKEALKIFSNESLTTYYLGNSSCINNCPDGCDESCGPQDCGLNCGPNYG